jgi:16S rRNA (uracil1498-N3)-methyltransferase
MRISRLLLTQPLAVGKDIALEVDQAHYLRNVLRLKSGQQVILFDGSSPVDFTAEVSIQGKQVTVSLQSSTQKQHDSSLDVRIVQGIGHAEHNDLVVQKTCELGVSELVFFNAQHSQTPIKPSRVVKKLEHWNRVAQAACAQSNRNILPVIRCFNSLGEYLNTLPANSTGLVLTFSALPFVQAQQKLDSAGPCAVIVGPEGGLSQPELDLVTERGFIATSLGPRVLRMETAAICALALLQHHLGDMP